eukprot:s5380_g2.t1
MPFLATVVAHVSLLGLALGTCRGTLSRLVLLVPLVVSSFTLAVGWSVSRSCRRTVAVAGRSCRRTVAVAGRSCRRAVVAVSGRLCRRELAAECCVGKELREEPRLGTMAIKAHAKWVRPSRPVPEIWVHDESPEMVTEGSAMAKAPAGTTEDPAMVEEVGSEDELEDITPVMEEIWTPPYHVPESSWSEWCSAGHLMSAGHSTAIPKWIQWEAGPENSTSVRGGRAGGEDKEKIKELQQELESKGSTAGSQAAAAEENKRSQKEEATEGTTPAAAAEEEEDPEKGDKEEDP